VPTEEEEEDYLHSTAFVVVVVVVVVVVCCCLKCENGNELSNIKMKPCMYVASPPYVPHVQFISSSVISSPQ
jgi:hypothetical protein